MKLVKTTSFVICVLVLTLIGCGSGKHPEPQSQAQSNGNCSETFIKSLNEILIRVKDFDRYGVAVGGQLVEAHKTVEQIKATYPALSCVAHNSISGSDQVVDFEEIESLEKRVFDRLYNAHFYRCRGSQVRDEHDTLGCSNIQHYLKLRFGY